MARKIEKSEIKKIIEYYKNNNLSMQQVADKFKVSKGTVFQIMKKHGIKIDAQRTKMNKKAWNSGLSKSTDQRVAKYAKTKSKEYILDGYRMVWSDILNKSVREHHKIWFENTGYWPNSKIGDQIHHIDGNKLNNDFNNLALCSVQKHSEIHKQYEELTCKLMQLGFVKFNIKKLKLEYDDFLRFIQLKRSEDDHATRFKE